MRGVSGGGTHRRHTQVVRFLGGRCPVSHPSNHPVGRTKPPAALGPRVEGAVKAPLTRVGRFTVTGKQSGLPAGQRLLSLLTPIAQAHGQARGVVKGAVESGDQGRRIINGMQPATDAGHLVSQRPPGQKLTPRQTA